MEQPFRTRFNITKKIIKNKKKIIRLALFHVTKKYQKKKYNNHLPYFMQQVSSYIYITFNITTASDFLFSGGIEREFLEKNPAPNGGF